MEHSTVLKDYKTKTNHSLKHHYKKVDSGERIESGYQGKIELWKRMEDERSIPELFVFKTISVEDDGDCELNTMLRLSKTGGHDRVVPLLEFQLNFPAFDYYTLVLPCYLAGDVARLQRENYETELPEPMVWTMLSDIARALCFVHNQGIFHLDIKPINIFVDKSAPYRFVLGDFGVARDSGKVEGVDIDTAPAEYQPPEADITDKTDVWALCATVHEIALGIPPMKFGAIDVQWWSNLSDEELERKFKPKEIGNAGAVSRKMHKAIYPRQCWNPQLNGYSPSLAQALQLGLDENTNSRPNIETLQIMLSSLEQEYQALARRDLSKDATKTKRQDSNQPSGQTKEDLETARKKWSAWKVKLAEQEAEEEPTNITLRSMLKEILLLGNVLS